MKHTLKVISICSLLLLITACDASGKGNAHLVITGQSTEIQLPNSNKAAWHPYTAVNGGIGVFSHYLLMPFRLGDDFSAISSRILDLDNNQFLSPLFTDYNRGLSILDSNRVFLVRENEEKDKYVGEIEMYDIVTNSIIKLGIKFFRSTVKISNDFGKFDVKGHVLALSDPIAKEIRIYNIATIHTPILLNSIVYAGDISELLIANNKIIWSESKEQDGYPTIDVKKYDIATKNIEQFAADYSIVGDLVSDDEHLAYVGRNRSCIIGKSELDCNNDDKTMTIVLSDINNHIIKTVVTNGNLFSGHLALNKEWLAWTYAEGDASVHLEVMYIPTQAIYRFDETDLQMEVSGPLFITEKEVIYLRSPRDFNNSESHTLQRLPLPKVIS